MKNFALIVGAMKCGTTSLFSYLEQHPEIAASKDKEPGFFDNDTLWSQGFEWYKTLWDWDSSCHKIALEGSTGYTRIPSYKNVTNRILSLQSKENLRFKFIYLIRDPIQRIESHYTHANAWNFSEAELPLSKGIASDLIAVSSYAMQISPYYEKFLGDDILIVKFEDLKHNTKSVLRKICIFLDVNPDFDFNTDYIYNAGTERINYSKSWKLLRQIRSLRYLVKFVPFNLKIFIGKSIFGKKVKDNVSLSNDLKKFLIYSLRYDLARLQEEYGIDISNWSIEID